MWLKMYKENITVNITKPHSFVILTIPSDTSDITGYWYHGRNNLTKNMTDYISMVIKLPILKMFICI